jgi:FkbM family methyltransferase
MTQVHERRLLRRVLLPLLSKWGDRDITIQHHYVHSPFRLNVFKHRGYWYHGKRREHSTMETLGRLLSRGDVVLEVGGHIGYLTVFFAGLVGREGKVFVFEPGVNNLPYIKSNIRLFPQVSLIQKAITDHNGEIEFYVESLSGQNNTVCADFPRFARVANMAFVESEYTTVKIESETLDSFVSAVHVAPRLIKIDVEGAELLVLRHAVETLRSLRPLLVMEIDMNHHEVVSLLHANGYEVFTPELVRLRDAAEVGGNVFAFPSEAIPALRNRMRC